MFFHKNIKLKIRLLSHSCLQTITLQNIEVMRVQLHIKMCLIHFKEMRLAIGNLQVINLRVITIQFPIKLDSNLVFV